MNHFISLCYASLNNSKYTNPRSIYLTGTDHFNSKLSKNIQFEKTFTYYFFFNILVSNNFIINLQNQSPKVIFWKNCPYPYIKRYGSQSTGRYKQKIHETCRKVNPLYSSLDLQKITQL